MTKLKLFLSVMSFFMYASCHKESPVLAPTTPTPTTSIRVENISKLVEMNHALGWKIFNQEQRNKPNENILVSPLSIQTALNMSMNGAKGNTLEEILKLMDCPGCSVSDINTLHKKLTYLLTEQSGHPKLKLANVFFYDKSRIKIKSPFLQILDESYACDAMESDFNAESAALQQINAWVKTNTNEKIEKIIEKITPLDVAFLINALHFKADWAIGFSPKETFKSKFTKTDGTEILVDYVSADRNFAIAKTAHYNLVDIPFKDSTYSISFIQPSKANTDINWHLNITSTSWMGMYEGMKYGRALVFFPKLKLSYGNDLIETLNILGVQDPFSVTFADFTTMGTAARNVFIDQIRHKSVLAIDEKGAEGASVTSVGFAQISAPPLFLFDHPFVLVLRHIPTNTMIFTGYVANPAF